MSRANYIQDHARHKTHNTANTVEIKLPVQYRKYTLFSNTLLVIKFVPHVRGIQIVIEERQITSQQEQQQLFPMMWDENNMLILVISECWVGVDWKK